MTMKDKYKADNFLFDISAAVDAALCQTVCET